jgi:hypothetical protein
MPNDQRQKLARIIAGRISQLKPEKIDAVRSTLDQFVGFVTQDTLYRLRQAVADHENAPAEGWDGRVAVILGLCDAYLKGDGKAPGNVDKALAVENIKAEALVESGRRKAEAQYLADAYAKNPDKPPSPTPLDKQSALTLSKAHPAADALAHGNTYQGVHGADQVALDLIQRYGLTEAEILAVKVYTAPDYKYINPATANDEVWMAKPGQEQFKGKPENYLNTDQGRAEMRQLLQEGSLHSAMVVAALQKMEQKTGLCFRGERMTPAEFKKSYGDAEPYELPAVKKTALTSIATDRSSAEYFANLSKDKEQTISVMSEVQVTSGREIRDLSIQGRGEGEWLLLPDTVLQTDSVQELPTGDAGSPQATRWFIVKAHQEG